MSDVGGWTEDRIEKARKLYIDQGMSAAQTARMVTAGTFRPSRNAVIGVMHRRGYRRPEASRPSPVKLASTPVLKRAPIAKPAATKGAKIDPFNAKSVPLDWKPETAPLREVHTGVEPKHWTERRFGECTWIVSGYGADSMACCAPVHFRSWCKLHCEIGFAPRKTSVADWMRGLRRYA